MRNTLTIYAVIFCIINLFVLVPTIAAANISGNLYFKDGSTPVKNATIILSDNAGNKYTSSITNEMGAYSIENIPAGEYDIKVKARTFNRSVDTSEVAQYFVQGRLIVEDEALVGLNLMLNLSPAGLFMLSPIGIALIAGVTGGAVYAAVEILDDDDDPSPAHP